MPSDKKPAYRIIITQDPDRSTWSWGIYSVGDDEYLPDECLSYDNDCATKHKAWALASKELDRLVGNEDENEDEPYDNSANHDIEYGGWGF